MLYCPKCKNKLEIKKNFIECNCFIIAFSGIDNYFNSISVGQNLLYKSGNFYDSNYGDLTTKMNIEDIVYFKINSCTQDNIYKIYDAIIKIIDNLMFL